MPLVETGQNWTGSGYANTGVRGVREAGTTASGTLHKGNFAIRPMGGYQTTGAALVGQVPNTGLPGFLTHGLPNLSGAYGGVGKFTSKATDQLGARRTAAANQTAQDRDAAVAAHPASRTEAFSGPAQSQSPLQSQSPIQSPYNWATETPPASTPGPIRSRIGSFGSMGDTVSRMAAAIRTPTAPF